MRTLNNTILHIRLERLVSWLQWAVMLVALVVYIYFIATTVVQVVLRQELLVSIQNVETNISKLEAVYFESSNKLSKDMASEYGLVAIAPIAYVDVMVENRLTRKD